MSLEELIHCQEVDLDLVKKIWINYTKCSLARRTPTNIRARLRDLERFSENCRNRHYRINALVESKEANEYFKTDFYATIVEECEMVRDNLQAALDAMVIPPSDQAKTVTPASSVAQLPPMPLPKFNGEHTAWCSFRDLFVSLVHDREDLTKVQKLHYLKVSLTGDAEIHLRNVKLTDDNYLPAWEALCAEFDSTRLILYAHFDDLLAIPSVGRNCSADLADIRKRVVNCYKAILNLKRPIDKWVDLFLYLVVKKFDRVTAEAWEFELKDANCLPTLQQLIDFLAIRIRVTANHSGSSIQNPPAKTVRIPVVRSHMTDVSGVTCSVCNGSHPLFQCQEFLKRTVPERYDLLRSERRCFNCFKQGHLPQACPGKNTCKKCRRRHHTLLHTEKKAAPHHPEGSVKEASPPEAPASGAFASHHSSAVETCETVIPTATVLVLGPSGASRSVRAILDPAAQASFIDEGVAREIASRREGMDALVSVTGGTISQRVKHAIYLTVRPPDLSAPSVEMKALVVKKVSKYSSTLSNTLRYLPPGLTLADKTELSTHPVQLIIGADYVGAFMLPEMVRIPNSYAYLQKSTCGWVMIGNPLIGSKSAKGKSVIVSHSTCVRPLLDELARFWQIEEVPAPSQLSQEDAECEEHFKNTHTRLPDGRYCVRLPFRGEQRPQVHGEKYSALSAFSRQEQRLAKNPTLGQEYNAFLQEYYDLGHMERVPTEEDRDGLGWYLPHHPVFKQEGVSKKIRVVFNASFADRSGMSLNDVLSVGPKLQADIAAILIRWRLFQFAVSTDIAKMFRQIQVDPQDRDWQRIVWRPTAEERIVSFRLTTVTYGTTCAPYLANRVLQQLADDEGSKYSLAEPILRRCVYVDDILFGSDDPQELHRTCVELRELLRAGGFPTHKWRSNAPQHIPGFQETLLDGSSSMTLAEDNSIRVLGIVWKPLADTFTFNVEPLPIVTTKRTFLSLLAKCYDPLGWLTPAIIVGKTIMQALWLRKVEWDAPLPKDIAEQCLTLQEQLLTLNKVSIPRWTGWSPRGAALQLFGFADASNTAYAATVYLRVQRGDDCQTSLLFAKSKVAPLKTLSIPRLELCAALLLVRAVKFLTDAMTIPNVPVFLHTDSQIILAWISAPPSRWKVFVSHRVAEIQTTLPTAIWRHVATGENPADCASRGLLPLQLLSHSLWWQGPTWLSEHSLTPVIDESVPFDTEEERRKEACTHHTSTDPFPFSDFSSWPRLLRVFAFVLRLVPRHRKLSSITSGVCLSVAELDSARDRICRLLQATFFNLKGIIRVGDKLQIKDKQLLSLSPFMDRDGLIRVGGRLRHANLPFATKFPILLPDCHVSRLIVRHFHAATLHGGLQVTLRVVRRSFWILRARNIARHCIRSCVTCVRYRAEVPRQLMGDLPPARVTPSRPFTHTGVDYAGPIHVRLASGRGRKSQKAYCAVFICLCTRAIHLECVSDYSTHTFLAAFQRFCARRGLPAVVYSDNGSNFVGADRELRRSFLEACRDPDVHNKISIDGVQWSFIPPASPHFGGLWEAGVKCMKHHLRRVLGASTPTLEELNTFLCQIEAVLNSRPIVPLRDDPDSFDALTPGHFLVGTALKEPAVSSLLKTPENRLTRWQTIQQQKQRFWKMWSSDFLNSLQQRSKWSSVQPNLAIGDLVIIKSPLAPPAHWELGRITKVFPGPDDLVRVVEVKTPRSTFKRPISQLCRLPTSDA